jgi:hypothetical protein
MFSRNSSSSRAIKFEKMLEMVKTNPFIPMKWMKDHTGMQGNEYFEDEEEIIRRNIWLACRWNAMEDAQRLSNLGVSKQIVNRLLEPFMWHKVILTATEFENFFAQRLDPAAEIHIQELSKLMLLAINDSQPKLLKAGEWHIPYGNNIIDEDLMDQLIGTEYFDNYYDNPILTKCKIAIARCAGVSYTVVGEDGNVEDYSKLLKRFDKLLAGGHMSPFEHVAKAMDNNEKDYICNRNGGYLGNFSGFIQYRKTIINENKSDKRLLKKEIKKFDINKLDL